MATIDSKEIIKKLLEQDGRYPGDPQVTSIWSYETSWGAKTQVVFWSVNQDMKTSPFVRDPKLLWSRSEGLTEEGKKWLKENS